jgi:hypothetical protein
MNVSQVRWNRPQCDTHQLIFSASSTMIPAGPRT